MAAASERFPGACVGIAVHSWASDIDCQGQFVLLKKGWSETRETSDGNRMRLSTRFSVLNRWPAAAGSCSLNNERFSSLYRITTLGDPGTRVLLGVVGRP